MSTTSRPAATTVAPVPASGRPVAVQHVSPSPAQLLRQGLEGTPGKLRLAAALSVLVCLAFALVGGYAFLSWGAALDDAKADAAQLVRVQQLQNDLVAADAAASNQYLSAGTKDAAGRQKQQSEDYAAAVAQASTLITAAAAANAADAQKLQAVSDGIGRYRELVTSAGNYNRQQYQVGAAYLRQAGDVLRKELVPALESVASDNRTRVAAAYESANRATALLTGAGILGLAGLGVTQLWLARRTHRVLNVPLVTATAGLIIALVAGASALTSVASDATTVGRTSYAATVALAQARTAAFDAKSQESLGLIARGNSSLAEAAVAGGIGVVREALGSAKAAGAEDLTQSFAAWQKAHTTIRQTDDNGDWATAQDLATTLASGGSNALFSAFDGQLQKQLDTQAGLVSRTLSSSRGVLVVLGWLTLALGLIAAGAAYLGVSQRLGEYR